MRKESLEQIHKGQYAPPTTKSVTLMVTGLLCTSERQAWKNTTEMEEGDDNW